MYSWLHSLHFRLILGFALVLAAALAGVSLYVSYAAQKEVERFRHAQEQARAARIAWLMERHYERRRGWQDAQTALDQAGIVSGRHIVLSDPSGNMVAESQEEPPPDSNYIRNEAPIDIVEPLGGEQGSLGRLEITERSAADLMPEPPSTLLLTRLNQSLLWTGLIAGAVGIVLVSLLSRRMLAPARSLSAAAGKLGKGDFTQRVKTSRRDEIGQLARTFNTMAAGLEAAERQRRAMVADVAHELRTPLSNIKGYLEAVRDGVLQPDPPTVDIIYQQVAHLTRLVEDLRALALAEAGKLPLWREVAASAELLESAIAAVRPRAEARGIRLALEAAPGLPQLWVDCARIEQVMSNLLENAIRHTPAGGAVTVVAKMAGPDRLRVTVADTGQGIPPDALPYVFDRFYRVDPSRNRATGGAGLGLTIARQLILAHGGKIWAASVVGEGSQFTFELPLSGASGQEMDHFESIGSARKRS